MGGGWRGVQYGRWAARAGGFILRQAQDEYGGRRVQYGGRAGRDE